MNIVYYNMVIYGFNAHRIQLSLQMDKKRRCEVFCYPLSKIAKRASESSIVADSSIVRFAFMVNRSFQVTLHMN